MLGISKDLFFGWEEKEIRYCHWKSNEHLKEGISGETDMDVLVDCKQKELCEISLRELKFMKANPQFGCRYNYVDEWIGFDYETGRLVHLHLHYKIVTGIKYIKEFVLPWDNKALKERIKSTEFETYIINPELELIILFSRLILKSSVASKIKSCFGKFEIPKDYKIEIDYLVMKIDKNKLKELVEEIFGIKSKDVFDIIKKNNISAKEYLKLRGIIRKYLIENNGVIKKNVIVKSFLSKNIIRVKNLLRKKFKIVNILRKTVPNEGIEIAFLGADGSGKSTVSEEISKWLSWKLDCERFYLGSGDHYKTFYSRIVKFIHGKMRKIKQNNAKLNLKEKSEVSCKEEKQSSRISFIRKQYDIFNMIYLVNITKRCYKLLLKARKYTKCGGIAIYDRFPQVKFKGINDGPKIYERYSKYKEKKFFCYLRNKEEHYLEKSVVSEPNIVFKLQITPEDSIKRKPDHDYEEVAKKVNIIDSLRFSQARVYNIDASQNYDQEILEVKRKIWDYIVKGL